MQQLKDKIAEAVKKYLEKDRECQVTIGSVKRMYWIAEVPIPSLLTCYSCESTCAIHRSYGIDYAFYYKDQIRVIPFEGMYLPGMDSTYSVPLIIKELLLWQRSIDGEDVSEQLASIQKIKDTSAALYHQAIEKYMREKKEREDIGKEKLRELTQISEDLGLYE